MRVLAYPTPPTLRDFGRQRPRDPTETDSLAEGTGFEPSVPPRKRRPSREAPRPTILVSRDDLCLMTPGSPRPPPGNHRGPVRAVIPAFLPFLTAPHESRSESTRRFTCVSSDTALRVAGSPNS